MGGFKEELPAMEALKVFMTNNFEDCKVTNNEIIKRCHFCGVSKDPRAKHLYIGPNKDGIIMYNCFKCQAGGICNLEFFKSMGVFDVDIIGMIVQNNKEHSNGTFRPTSKPSNWHLRKPMNINIGTLGSEKKIAYINKRLGTSLNANEIAGLKIVLNVKDFIDDNHIRTYTRSPAIMDEINIGFLGFLSVDNSRIVCRRLVPENKVHPNLRERYCIYKINGTDNYSSPFYVIPGSIDPSSHINVIIAEGPFDILSVYFNLPRYTNAIYVSSNGKTAYKVLLGYLITTLRIPIFDTTFHFYSDNDLNKYEISTLQRMMQAINVESYIHFNHYTGEKDYGVPKERIKDSVYLLSQR